MLQNKINFYRYWATLMIGVVGLAVSGCGDSGVPVYPVTGKLLVNGQPAPGAIIGLHPVSGDFDERGTRPAGRVNDDGTFTISCYDVGDGAPAGAYKVSIFWPQFPDRDDPGRDRMGGRYANPELSQLQITIHEGENTLEPIALEKVKLLRGS